jgi:glyoxylase-like metal-dependent hydrolase (beta-lactamase superfamily II)
MSESGEAAAAALCFPCGDAPAPGAAREVAPGVLWLRLPLPASLAYINIWAVRDGAGWAVFDSGMLTAQAQQVWRALAAPGGALGGLPPTRVFATHMHPDHVGMAGWLQHEFGCELWMTGEEYLHCRLLVADTGREAPTIATRFYRRAGWNAAAIARYRERFGRFGEMVAPLPESFQRLRDGQHIPIQDHAWRVIVGSGHSPEHACFHCADRQLLISGDQVLPLISSNVSVFPTEPNADPLEDWLQSIARLRRDVPDDVLVLPAHNDPFRGLHARLDRLSGKRAAGLQHLRALLAREPRRAVDTFEALFRRPIDNHRLLQLATGESLAYLNHLVHRGEAEATEDAQGVCWYRAAA